MRSDGCTVEIYFDDLNQEAQYELTRLFGHNVSYNDIIAEMTMPIQNVIIIKNDERTHKVLSFFFYFFLY